MQFRPLSLPNAGHRDKAGVVMTTSKRWWWAVGALVVMGVVAALATTKWSTRLEAAPAPKTPPAVPVRIAQATHQTIPLAMQVIGQVQSLHQVLIRPQIEGVLTEVRFTEGQRVRRGDILARLDDRALRAELAQAEAELARLQAQRQLAEADLARYEGLAAQKAVPVQQRDQQAAAVAQARSQVQAQQAAIAAARVQLSFTVITSPVDGRVGLRAVDVGNLVRPTDAAGLVTVVQTQPMAVVFSAPQSRLGEVRDALKMKGGAMVRVADQERGTPLAEGRLLTADNTVDAGNGSLRLKAQVPNTQENLWPGQFVAVTLVTGDMPRALVVPAAAVQRGLKGSFVWRVAGGKADMVPVSVRWQDDEHAVLAAPSAAGAPPVAGSAATTAATTPAATRPAAIAPGDRIVVDGQSRLKPAATVRVLDDQKKG
jgi:RND family efflux transporter MFP subunit